MKIEDLIIELDLPISTLKELTNEIEQKMRENTYNTSLSDINIYRNFNFAIKCVVNSLNDICKKYNKIIEEYYTKSTGIKDITQEL